MRFRSLKLFGSVLVLAISLTASAAHAANFTINSGEYPATLTGEQTNENVISNGIRSFTCKKATLTSTLAGASSSALIHPAYSECTANGGIPTTVSMNGCDIDEVLTSFGGTGLLHTELECPAGKKVVISIYSSAANHSNGIILCQLVMEAPQIFTGGTATNNGAGVGAFVSTAWTSNSLTIKRVLGTAANCGVEEQKSGTYNGKLKYTAKNKAGFATGLLVG